MIYKFHFWVCNIGLAKKLGVFYNRLWRNSKRTYWPTQYSQKNWKQDLRYLCPQVQAPLFIAAKRWSNPSIHRWMNGQAKCDQFSSVSQSCLTLCEPMDYSTPSLPVHHQLQEFTQTHVHWVGDAIQPSHPLSSPSPSFNLSQHQGLFKWVSSSHQVVKVFEFQFQHQSFQWIFRTDFL